MKTLVRIQAMAGRHCEFEVLTFILAPSLIIAVQTRLSDLFCFHEIEVVRYVNCCQAARVAKCAR